MMKEENATRKSAMDGQAGTAMGPYSIGHDIFVLHDAHRGKRLEVWADYPSAKVDAPVVIISHGAGGEGANMRLLTEFWATHGYACFAPTHDDLDRMGTPDNPKDVYSPEGAAGRVADLALIMDSLGALERENALPCRLNAGRIGIAGHSYGAYIAMLIGGAVPMIDGAGQVLEDDRPRAFLILSGAGAGILGLTESSWAACHRPLMAMTGSLDSRGEGQGPEWRKQSFLLSPAGGKYLVYLEGARHNSFTGRAAVEAENRTAEAAIFNCIKLASLKFWDSYLKDDLTALGFLTHRGLESASGGIASLYWR